MGPPLQGWHKLNFDGSASPALGIVATRGVIRLRTRDLIVAFTWNLNGCSSNQAKGMTLRWGLKLALTIGLSRVIIEGDSKLIINVVTGRSMINWSIDGVIKYIQLLLLGLDAYHIDHVYKEDNSVCGCYGCYGCPIGGLEVLEGGQLFTGSS
ncbi:uncharacterized protein LOC131045046 [Cryptomeria japonica]|uniref:uncharacterized protein LOC131045046 n=1 Tax=Cryptomeria japonica TaxID=3369 RepID=UPI0027DAA741|nr:uncharacterized protein LOC131045046 [Cryptomeria japonica]